MTGKPGRSGGQRAGAGRPVASWRLRQGENFVVHETHDGRACGLTKLATVKIKSRSTLLLELDDGTTIRLMR